MGPADSANTLFSVTITEKRKVQSGCFLQLWHAALAGQELKILPSQLQGCWADRGALAWPLSWFLSSAEVNAAQGTVGYSHAVSHTSLTPASAGDVSERMHRWSRVCSLAIFLLSTLEVKFNLRCTSNCAWGGEILTVCSGNFYLATAPVPMSCLWSVAGNKNRRNPKTLRQEQ